MSPLGRVIRFSLSDGVPLRSGCVALVVGTILNLTNQGDAIFGTTPVNWIRPRFSDDLPSLRNGQDGAFASRCVSNRL